jgi:hypothetical protein
LIFIEVPSEERNAGNRGGFYQARRAVSTIGLSADVSSGFGRSGTWAELAVRRQCVDPMMFCGLLRSRYVLGC